jgi:hypothetical protein
MSRKIYDMLGLPPLENCYVGVHLSDFAKKKPLGRINDVLIIVNNNLVLVDFLVVDIECNASCPIILGRPFLRTVGVIIDMIEDTIRYQFPLNKGMEHFPRKRKKLPFYSCRCSGYRGIPVHLLLGPLIGLASAQGRNDDRSLAEKTLMRRRLMRRTTAKRLRTRRPPHELFLVRGRTTSTSALHVSMLSKKIGAEDCVLSTLPPTRRRPTFAVPA